MKNYIDNIFTFGVGMLLISAANAGIEIWDAVHWIFAGMIIYSALVSMVSFGGFGLFWVSALKHLDVFGPNCERHDYALETYKESAASVEPFKNPSMFFLSFAGSLTLMAGLLLQGWHITLGFEIAGSAIGYGFIHYFQMNKNIILGQITGADEAAG